MPNRYVYYGLGIPLGVPNGAEHMLSLGEGGGEGLEREERGGLRGGLEGVGDGGRAARSAEKKIGKRNEKETETTAGCTPAALSRLSVVFRAGFGEFRVSLMFRAGFIDFRVGLVGLESAVCTQDDVGPAFCAQH